MNIHSWVSVGFRRIFVLIGVIISIPFLTLFERKVLRYIQFRKGPKKVRVNGLLQPIADGVKLALKETVVPFTTNYFVYMFSPLFRFFLMILLWMFFPFKCSGLVVELGRIIFFCVSSLGVYTLFFRG